MVAFECAPSPQLRSNNAQFRPSWLQREFTRWAAAHAAPARCVLRLTKCPPPACYSSPTFGRTAAMMRTKPPFRADVVGSILRTAPLKEARAKREKGEISAAQLKEVEDRERSEER